MTTVDHNDTGRTAKEESGKARTGPGAGALVGGSGRVVWSAEQMWEPRARGAEEDHQGDGGEGGEKGKPRKGKPSCRGKEDEAKPANHKNVRLFGVWRAEAQRNEDEDSEGKHSFGQSAGSSVFGQGVRGSLARQNVDGGISRRDFCGQRFKDDTGKLFKNDGGEDFETRSGENSGRR